MADRLLVEVVIAAESLLDEANAEIERLRYTLRAYRSAVRCGEPESEQLVALMERVMSTDD